jgi:hydrogenase maturation protease
MMETDKYSHKSPSVLILGIGNLLMGDEGLGVHYARRLEKALLPPHVEVVDGGTGGFHLMSWFEKFDEIIMVDAALDGRPPGHIREVTPRFSSDFPRAMSTHDIGLKDLVEGLYLLGRPPKIHLFAVSIETVQPMHIGLSPAIEAILPELIERTHRKIEALSGSIAGEE